MILYGTRVRCVKATLCLPKFKTIGYVAANSGIGSSLIIRKQVCDVKGLAYVGVQDG